MLEERDASGNVLARYDYGDDLIRMDRGGLTRYYLFDGLGSTRQLTDGTGSVTDTYAYDAFGNLTSETGSTVNPYLFNGQEQDAGTGLYYLRARYMNPQDGRFISQDPFGGDNEDPISLHRYLYASSDPVNRVDPSGALDGIAEVTVSLGLQQVIAGAVLAGIAGIVTGSSGGSPLQIIQSVEYGAISGASLIFAISSGNGFTAISSAILGGLAGSLLTDILSSPVYGHPASQLDLVFAFERGFANSALSSAFGGKAGFKGQLGFAISFYDDITNYVRKDYESEQVGGDGFKYILNQIVQSGVSAGISGLLGYIKQYATDSFFADEGAPSPNTYILSKLLTAKDVVKFSFDVVQKVGSVSAKSPFKAIFHNFAPGI